MSLSSTFSTSTVWNLAHVGSALQGLSSSGSETGKYHLAPGVMDESPLAQGSLPPPPLGLSMLSMGHVGRGAPLPPPAPLPLTYDAAEISYNMSNNIARIAMSTDKQVRMQAAGELRTNYLAVIQGQDGNPHTSWKQVFVEIGRQLIGKLSISLGTESSKKIEARARVIITSSSTSTSSSSSESDAPLESTTSSMEVTPPVHKSPSFPELKVRITSAGEKARVFTTAENLLLMGRLIDPKSTSDIYMPGVGGSRLHAVIYVLKEINKIAVVDVGSLTGILMQSRTGPGDIVSSTSTDRNVILLDPNESTVLKMGVFTVTIGKQAEDVEVEESTSDKKKKRLSKLHHRRRK